MESLAEVISDLRIEIGLPPFKINERVLCSLYRSEDIQFRGTIHEIQKQGRARIYLIDCPLAYGFSLNELVIKEQTLKDKDQTLYYRWVEEVTISLIYP